MRKKGWSADEFNFWSRAGSGANGCVGVGSAERDVTGYGETEGFYGDYGQLKRNER
jgi:hypothetical protein